MSQIDPTPPFRSPDGTLESRRRAFPNRLSPSPVRCTSTLSRGPAALGNQARKGMVAYQKAGRVRTYTVEPKAFEAP